MGEEKEIQKESLVFIKYPDKDILKSKIQRLRRKNNLYAAMLLGNGFKTTDMYLMLYDIFQLFVIN